MNSFFFAMRRHCYTQDTLPAVAAFLNVLMPVRRVAFLGRQSSSLAFSKRENVKFVMNGCDISYKTASPSMAPSALADVVTTGFVALYV